MQIMETLGSRMQLWHITDRGCRQRGPYMTPILEENTVELGAGNMDLDTLFEIALRNGTQGIILYDSGHISKGGCFFNISMSDEMIMRLPSRTL